MGNGKDCVYVVRVSAAKEVAGGRDKCLILYFRTIMRWKMVTLT